MQGNGIDRYNPVLVGQFIEPREPLHIFRILIHAMQQNHHRIVLLRIVTFRQPHHEIPVHVVDCDFFFRFLRPERLSDQQNTQAAESRHRTPYVRVSSFHLVSSIL